MLKADFISTASDFINHVGVCLTNFQHSYFIRSNNNAAWSCNGLIDSYNKYKWPFNALNNTYAHNKTILDNLSHRIRIAMNAHNENDLRDTSIAIFKWGGVQNGNNKKIIAVYGQIYDHFDRTRNQLHQGGNDTQLANVFNMNAGFTKIYSLLIDEIIIYDSRVGAALGLLVQDFFRANPQSKVPQELFFPFAHAKEGQFATHAKNRSPGSIGGKNFPNFSGNQPLHAVFNLRASWLVSEVIKRFNPFPGTSMGEQMRRLEAALFMIGYDLPKVAL